MTTLAFRARRNRPFRRRTAVAMTIIALTSTACGSSISSEPSSFLPTSTPASRNSAPPVTNHDARDAVSTTNATPTSLASTDPRLTDPRLTEPPPTEPTSPISVVDRDFVEFAGGDIFGDVVGGADSAWIATTTGLIQVDPDTMDATWHTGIAPGKAIAYAFDSLWVTGSGPAVLRVDPTTLEVIASIPVKDAEGIAAGDDSVWISQHRDGTVVRIDPVTNSVAETLSVVATSGRPMKPSAFDGEVWLALGNARAVVRIDANRNVTEFAVPSEVLAAPVATPDAVWFPAGLDVTRVDRASGAVTTASVGRDVMGPFGSLWRGVNIDGMLWFSAPSKLIAFDPITSQVAGTVQRRGGYARNVIVYENALWVMSETGGSLERIPLDELVTS
jgi:streptogramin lyase